MKKRWLSIVLVLTMLTTLFPVTAMAADNTIYVSSTGSDAGAGTETDPYASLSKAVAEASSGDTIVVLSDLTVENTVVIDKNLTIQGIYQNNPDTTVRPVLSTDSEATAFYSMFRLSTGVTANFANLNFSGSNTNFSINASNYGGAIVAESDSAMTMNCKNIELSVTNCDFSDFEAHGGGAIGLHYIDTANVTISGTSFENNSADLCGGAVGFVDCIAITLQSTNSKFTENQAGALGGAIGSNGSNGSKTDSFAITNCQFQNNKINYTSTDSNSASVFGGGAIGIKEVRGKTIEVDIKSSRFEGNTTASSRFTSGNDPRGGAFHILAGAYTLNLEQCTFTNNHAEGHGGAINLDVDADYEAHFSMQGTTFENNISDSRGGAIHIAGGGIHTDIDKTLFQSNSAKSGLGNAIVFFYSGNAKTTSAIHSTDGAIFDNNGGTLETGDTIYLQSSSGADDTVLISDYMMDGTRMRWKTDDQDDEGNDILSPLERSEYAKIDLGTTGGSLYLDTETVAPSYSPDTYSNLFIGNTAGNYGGAIFNYGSLTIGEPGEDITVTKNWTDENDQPLTTDLPASATVRLVRQSDQAEVDNAELTAANQWTHTFYDFPTNVTHKIAEDNIAGYTSEITNAESTSVTVTNKKLSNITIQPANITIYMGGHGYEGAVDDDGTLIMDAKAGFPEPGFRISLPDSLKNINVTEDLTLQYKDGSDIFTWEFEKYGEGEHDIYRIVPAGQTAARPVRIQFIKMVDGQEEVVDSDSEDFNAAQYINQTLTMKAYGEGIEEDKVSFVYDGQEYPITVKNGELTVRGTTAAAKTPNIAEPEDFTAVKDEPGVTAPAETKYFINNSDVQVDDDEGISLLFDHIIDTNVTVEDSTYTALLEEKVDAQLAELASNETRHYESRYLDLVDMNNGNAWVKASQDVTVYWPIQEGLDENTEFTLLHFEGLHRSMTPEEITAKLTDENYAPTPITNFKVEGDHLVFETDSFSPYVLVWETTSSGGGGGGTTYYTLHYESNGGTEYADESYASGTTVQLTKVPTREGYTFTGWYADAALTKPVTEIKMTAKTTVYAGWEITEVPDWLNGDDHFAYVIGYEDGTVQPLSNITRAEVATIFFRLLQEDVRTENLTETNVFTDVSADDWYNTAVSTMASLGIIKGRTETTFEPDAPITRAEFAAICARFDTGRTDGDSNFTDLSGHWAKDEIERAATLGWITGYPDGTFRPENAITRAEAMTMINRVLQRLPENESDLLSNMQTWPDNLSSAWYYLAVQEATNSHDFDRKADGVHEKWTALTENPDWTEFQ
ncbi:S-layer homology domain-containing protein [Agathobaculum sp. Marseille-P7918]|uniref:S-layer homology domain-containing protein n=1 Tax=Agathobaculum sp. Marseille-P7918 TaxID=2479843 RepID=UPI0013DE5666|nr:S-layer homology domain-containing protein [Agathobaculum sp. Marseille-P7918]